MAISDETPSRKTLTRASQSSSKQEAPEPSKDSPTTAIARVVVGLASVGDAVGASVGLTVSAPVGAPVGAIDGAVVGESVGAWRSPSAS